MPRLTNEQMLTEVTDAIAAAGGEVGHEQLVEQLNEVTARNLKQFVQSGGVVRKLTAQPGTKAVLTYSLPTGSPAAPGA